MFGAFTPDRERKESASDMVYKDGTRGKVFFLWHPYEPICASVEAFYEDGRAAVVSNRFGKGRAIVAGTEIFRQYFSKTPEEANTNFLRRQILESGAKRNAEVIINGKVADASSVEVCRLAGDKGAFT